MMMSFISSCRNKKTGAELHIYLRGLRRKEEGGGVRSGLGEARTILLFQIISDRPSKQPLMVRAFLKVYMELGSCFLFLQEQIKDIIIIKRLFRRPSTNDMKK
jgi:hypothetical protein